MKKLLSSFLALAICISFSSLSYAQTNYDLLSSGNLDATSTTANPVSFFRSLSMSDLTHDTSSSTIDEEARMNIEMAHINPAQIEFNAAVFDEASTLNDSYQEIAAFNVANNTMDGFTVTMRSANGGKLLPVGATHVHGETFIDYWIDIDKGQSTKLDNEFGREYPSGVVGTNCIVNTAEQNISVDTELSLINGRGQTSPTNATYSLKVKLVDSEGYGLAGTYKDSVVIIYRDY
jgi:hypothetical protein